MPLPPGQQQVEGFPRFGTHFQHPPPEVPAEPVIEVAGDAVTEPVTLKVSELATLRRRELAADFHCVAGWSATGLRWEGVAFRTFYDIVIEPALRPGDVVTHLVFQGLDRYRSFVQFEDALADDVLIAENLNGEPLDADHGAPVRLVSPSQYGFVSTKHLCRIEVCTGARREDYHPAPFIQIGLKLVKPHRRARVWREERHRYLPPWLVRPVYRLLIGPIRSARRRGRPDGTPD